MIASEASFLFFHVSRLDFVDGPLPGSTSSDAALYAHTDYVGTMRTACSKKKRVWEVGAAKGEYRPRLP